MVVETINNDTSLLSRLIVNEKTVKWCSVTLSSVFDRDKRLEASVYDIESLHAYQMINEKSKYKSINLIGNDNSPVFNAYYGNRLKRNYIHPSHPLAIGFIGSSEMLDCYPHPVKFMEESERTNDLHVKYGMLLLSRSGTIGNITFVNKTLEKLLVSEHAIRLECKNYPGYVYAYLKTKTGQLLIHSNIYGAVIQEIEPDHLKNIPIPDAPYEIKSKINNLIVRSYELRDESNELIEQATSLLINELHFPPIRDFDVELFKKNKNVDTFSVKLSHVDGRLDASYHVPIVQSITEHMVKYADEITTIGDERISKDVILPPRFARVYVDEGNGRVLLGGKQILELNPSGKKYISNSKHKELIKKLEVHKDTTLITRSGTIGKVALVPSHWEGFIPSDHIIRIVPSNEQIAGYIYIFLNSEYGNNLITHYTYGSVVDEIDDNHVRNIPLPLLKNKDIQKKINDFALEANEKRYEAYLYEQQALRIMNDEVIFAK